MKDMLPDFTPFFVFEGGRVCRRGHGSQVCWGGMLSREVRSDSPRTRTSSKAEIADLTSTQGTIEYISAVS